MEALGCGLEAGAGITAAPLKFQKIFGDGPAIVLRPHAVAHGDAHVIKEDRVHLMLAGDKNDRVHPQPRGVHGDQQKGNARLRLARAVRAHQGKHPVGMVRVGGPDLTAVQHIVIAVPTRIEGQSGKIGARAGLGVALAPVVLAGEDAGEEGGLLFLRAVTHKDRAAHAEAHGR